MEVPRVCVGTHVLRDWAWRILQVKAYWIKSTKIMWKLCLFKQGEKFFFVSGSTQKTLSVNRPDFILSKVQNSFIKSVSRSMYILTS